jgi:hypothetical protein
MTDQLHAYLTMLAGPAPAGKLIELRHRAPGGMRQMFVPARRPDLASSAITRLGWETDVYIGVLLRTRRRGGRDAVHTSHLLFAEIDQPDADARLARFRCPPCARVSSGTDGHRHAYWVLQNVVDAEQLAWANRRLAHALGADLASTDPARVLRPPSSMSFKRRPPVPVRLVQIDASRRYELSELVDGLTDPPSSNASRGPWRPRPATVDPVHERLLAIPAADYVHRLTGREPDRAGKVSCPFHHPDRTPSLQLYDDGTFYCFGCRAGGSVFDFAASLWQTGGTKGQAFLALRERLAHELLGADLPGRANTLHRR